MQIQEARPPFVSFETRAEEDREASIAQGHFVARDVDYALITPQGSKDRIERVVADWFASLQEQVQNDRFPSEWLRAYREHYKAWKEGSEAPVNGTAINNWPAASPAQVKMLQSLHVRTIEDLAAANEETISRMGMGGRALKQRAIEWLAASNDTGKVAERIAALEAKMTDVLARNESLEQQLRTVTAERDALAARTAPQKL